MKSKYKYGVSLLLALILLGAFYWFYNKFYPTQTGEWSQKDKNKFDENLVVNSGWEGNSFWTSLDFPGKQNVCLKISLKSPLEQNFKEKLSVGQAPRAYFYPKSGTLADLFALMSPAQVEEKIREGKPYLIEHLDKNVSREGKDLFFLGENEKFLIPTKGIFSKIFPAAELPQSVGQASSLPYADVLVNLPEGVLLSDGKGVFVISQGQLYLVRSPEVFEAMGYKWGDIAQMDNYEKSFNAYLSGNLIDFNAANPNGTILKDAQGLYLVWENKLYSLSEEELNKYFPGQPVVEASQKDLEGNCAGQSGSNKILCCTNNSIDPRLNPPYYFPYLNTLNWKLDSIATEKNIENIDWQSKLALNQENSLRRLGSLKNFVLYGLGILK